MILIPPSVISQQNTGLCVQVGSELWALCLGVSAPCLQCALRDLVTFPVTSLSLVLPPFLLLCLFQSIGKGSLWSIDPEYRHNLIQALKKTPYHPYSPGLATPPTSPPTLPQTFHHRWDSSADWLIDCPADVSEFPNESELDKNDAITDTADATADQRRYR